MDIKTTEDLKRYEIGLDDTFQFGCRQCGNCCRDRGDILITGPDIFRIARHFNVRLSDAIRKYCEMDIGADSKLPILKLGVKSHGDVCVFLRYGKCSIQPIKPGVCAVFPLARVYNRLTDTVGYLYDPLEHHCGSKQEHSVRDWITDCGLSQEDSDFITWSQALISLGSYVVNPNKRDQKRFEQRFSEIVDTLYLNYDITGTYAPQLRRNTQILLPHLDIKSIYFK